MAYLYIVHRLSQYLHGLCLCFVNNEHVAGRFAIGTKSYFLHGAFDLGA